MASRSDQLQSQQFVLQRVVGALAMRDPDPVSAPLRRIGGALLASFLVAGLGLAAVGIYGVLRPGGDAGWRDGSSVIVESETGARFVYRDGVLYPVLNYSSALLVLGTAAPTVRVPRAGLAAVPRGRPVGIPGAPDTLPAAADLWSGQWTVCSRSSTSGPAESVLLVGSGPVPRGAALADRAVLGADPAGGLHLLWHHRRFAITEPGLVLAAFAWSNRSAVAVAPAVLNAIPAGPDLGPVAVPAGTGPSAVDGYRSGQVFVVENQSGGRRFGVALTGGLADLTPVQADLLLAAGANGLGGRPLSMGEAQYAVAPRAASLVPTGDAAPPATTPELAAIGSGAGICAGFGDGAGVPDLGLVTAIPHTVGELPTAGTAAAGAGTVDWIEVAPGQGALVEAVTGPTGPAGPLALVTDLGTRFAVPSTDVAKLLGFGAVRPLRLPSALVALVPAGPALDPAVAALAATG